jgi:hypothetical protein
MTRDIDTTEIEKSVKNWENGTDPLAGVKLIEAITEQYGEAIDVEFQYLITWIRADNLVNLVNYNMAEWGSGSLDNPKFNRQDIFSLIVASNWMNYNLETDSFAK